MKCREVSLSGSGLMQVGPDQLVGIGRKTVVSHGQGPGVRIAESAAPRTPGAPPPAPSDYAGESSARTAFSSAQEVTHA